jgi:hypothetical protein
MARIRSIKPEIRKSLTVAAWPREVRLAWIYLWGYLDDHGRGLDDTRLVIAECFPLDRDVTEKKMESWLALMAEKPEHDREDHPPLCRYETGGRSYLHAVKWKDHQKTSHPQKSRIPSCPIHEPEALFA